MAAAHARSADHAWTSRHVTIRRRGRHRENAAGVPPASGRRPGGAPPPIASILLKEFQMLPATRLLLNTCKMKYLVRRNFTIDQTVLFGGVLDQIVLLQTSFPFSGTTGANRRDKAAVMLRQSARKASVQLARRCAARSVSHVARTVNARTTVGRSVVRCTSDCR